MYNKLAQIYNQNILEKTAADMLAEQVGFDVNNISPDQLEAYAQQMLSEADTAAASQQDVYAQGEPNLADTRQTALNTMPAEQLVQTPEFDQGDTIGKVAAYRIYRDLMPTMTNDIYETVKQAFYQVIKEAGFADSARSYAGAAKNTVRDVAGAAGGAVANAGRSVARNVQSRAGGAFNTAKEVAQKHPKKMIGAAAGLGALGAGGAYMASKEANFGGGFAPQGQIAPQQAPQQGQSSALDQMAQQKVMDYLQAQGYDLNQLFGGADQGQNVQEQPMQGQDMAVKMANDAIRSQVDQHTNQLAISMLQQLGINVNDTGADTSAQDQSQAPQGY